MTHEEHLKQLDKLLTELQLYIYDNCYEETAMKKLDEVFCELHDPGSTKCVPVK